jgi:hypothetical protein
LQMMLCSVNFLRESTGQRRVRTALPTSKLTRLTRDRGTTFDDNG